MVMSSRSVVNLQVEAGVIQTEVEIFQMACQRDWSVATLLHSYCIERHLTGVLAICWAYCCGLSSYLSAKKKCGLKKVALE